MLELILSIWKSNFILTKYWQKKKITKKRRKKETGKQNENSSKSNHTHQFDLGFSSFNFTFWYFSFKKLVYNKFFINFFAVYLKKLNSIIVRWFSSVAKLISFFKISNSKIVFWFILLLFFCWKKLSTWIKYVLLSSLVNKICSTDNFCFAHSFYGLSVDLVDFFFLNFSYQYK